MAASAMITAAGGVSRSKEVMFTCVADREVSYIALDKTFSHRCLDQKARS